MRKSALALIGAAALAFGGIAAPADVLAKEKPKTTKVLVKKAEKKAAPKTTLVKYQSKCKPGMKWNPSASLNAGACEKPAKVAKVKVKKAPKAAEKPAEKPAQIKKTG